MPLPSSQPKGPKDRAPVRPAVTSKTESDSILHGEGDSLPLNFDTFVPNHDPSLALPVPPYPASQAPDCSGNYLPEPLGHMISQDEAFTRALGAMYWAGYYSAIYHVSDFTSFRSECLGLTNSHSAERMIMASKALWRAKAVSKTTKIRTMMGTTIWFQPNAN